MAKKSGSTGRPRKTDRLFFTDQCPCCKGRGRVPPVKRLGGWFLNYHYQDGHEQSGPMRRADAVRRYREHRDPTSIVTLIGPDGYEYEL